MKQNNQEIERYRLSAEQLRKKGFSPRWASDGTYGNNGMFLVARRDGSLLCVVSDGGGWEHVSVSVLKRNRCPTWTEMCYAKDLFWEKDEVVIQYHPAEAEYISNHDFCLHLWRPVGADLPTPPPIFVGLKKGVTH